MINKKRKGFTIVELVIVIVIVGVLAAVLIPTFGSLIKQANESADKQTVYQMNIILAAESVEDGKLDVSKVIDILKDNGFDTENLKPSSDDLEFKWDDDNKVVILVRPGADDTSFEQIYPVVEDGNTSSNVVDLKKPTLAEILKTALSSGEDVTLPANEGEIVLNGPIVIPAGATPTIDLNQNTLTFGVGASLTVGADPESNQSVMLLAAAPNGVTINNGEVKIDPAYEAADWEAYSAEQEDLWNRYFDGEIDDDEIYDELDALEQKWSDLLELHDLPGINITTGGILSFQNVTLEGDRVTNIDNKGTVNLANTTFTVNSGIGMKNSGTAKLTDTDFSVNGYGCAVDNKSNAEINIYDTNFDVVYGYGVKNSGTANFLVDENNTESKNTFTASGEKVALLYNNGGDLVVNKTEFKEKAGQVVKYNTDGINGPISTSGGTVKLTDVSVTINDETKQALDGNFAYGSVYASGTSTVTISGGTFNGAFYCQSGNCSITINNAMYNNGTENIAITSDNVRNYCYNYKENTVNTHYSVIETTNGTNTYITLLGTTAYEHNTGITVPSGYTMKMDLKNHGFIMNEDIVVEDGGTLVIQGIKIYVGAKDGASRSGQIIVKNGGTCTLDTGMTFYGANRLPADYNTFYSASVAVEVGGIYNGTTFSEAKE